MDLKGVPVACAIAMVPTVPRETRYDPDASYMAVDATMAAENDDDDDDDDDERVTMLLDPTFDEERQAKASFVIAWAFGQGLATNRDESGKDPEAECVLMESEGAFDQIQVSLTSISPWSTRALMSPNPFWVRLIGSYKRHIMLLVSLASRFSTVSGLDGRAQLEPIA